MKTDLSLYNNDWFNPGKGALTRLVWYYCNLLFFQSYWFPFNTFKSGLLRLFGAKVGKACIWKPGVNIKYPWNLQVGNHCWIGEGVWIDNLTQIVLGDHVCLSQGAYLLCGNHNYKTITFDLLVEPIHLDDGAWVGAKAIVCPGSHFESHAILSAGSVAIGRLRAYGIYQGNPAQYKKKRDIKHKP